MWRLVILSLLGTGCGDELSRVMLKESAQEVPVYTADPAPMSALDMGLQPLDASQDDESDALPMASDGALTEDDADARLTPDQAVSNESDSAATISDSSVD